MPAFGTSNIRMGISGLSVLLHLSLVPPVIPAITEPSATHGFTILRIPPRQTSPCSGRCRSLRSYYEIYAERKRGKFSPIALSKNFHKKIDNIMRYTILSCLLFLTGIILPGCNPSSSGAIFQDTSGNARPRNLPRTMIF